LGCVYDYALERDGSDDVQKTQVSECELEHECHGHDHVSCGSENENESESESESEYLLSASDGGRPEGQYYVYEMVLHANENVHHGDDDVPP